MNDIAGLQKLIYEKKNILLGDNDIIDWYNILDIQIKNLKPRDSAFSFLLKGSIILIPIMLISANGILITLVSLFQTGNALLLATIISILFWIGITVSYFKFEEPLNFIKQSFKGKLKGIKNELTTQMNLRMKIIEELLARNLMFKNLKKIKREKIKIEKYLNKRAINF